MRAAAGPCISASMDLDWTGLTTKEWPLEVAALSVILALTLSVHFLAPRKVSLRLVWVMLLVHLTALGGHELARSSGARGLFAGVALVTLVLATGRSTFLFVFDVVVARRHADSFPKIVRDVTQVVVLFFVGLWSLRALGVETNQLLTTSAFVTLVVGLGLQETLGNVVAGLSLQIERPFVVGDVIEIHGTGHIGRVREVNWRATRIHTLDNVDVVVPNGLIAKTSVTNYDRPHANPRRTIIFSAPYDASPLAVERAALEALRDTPGVEGAGMVTLETFADSGINYALRFFITDATERERVEGAVRTRLWHAFARSGISFPFPVRVLEQRATVDPAAALRAAAEERVRALSAVDFLTPLGSESLERLAHQISMAVFAPGETVVKEGEPGSTMFVVESGELRVLMGEQEVASLGRGAFFGEMSLLTGEPRRASVRAANGCRLFVIDHESFKSVLSQNPEVARAISEKVAERAASSARKSDAATPAVPVSSSDLFERIRRFFGKR